MQLSELLKTYAQHPQVAALAKIIADHSPALTHIQGVQASAAPMVLASLSARKHPLSNAFLIVLNDEEEAGYFYHDLTQMLGDEQALFYPSTYRRAVKYAQRDAANEILRTEVLNRLAALCEESVSAKSTSPLYVVTFPAAIAERVAPPRSMAERTLRIATGSQHDLTELSKRLIDLGFKRKDYVYEPGEFAVRGSILDVYSFASEYPFRIDFFGDDVDSIRTFEVQTQLSKEKKTKSASCPTPKPMLRHNSCPLPTICPTTPFLCSKTLDLFTTPSSASIKKGLPDKLNKPKKSPPRWTRQHSTSV